MLVNKQEQNLNKKENEKENIKQCILLPPC